MGKIKKLWFDNDLLDMNDYLESADLSEFVTETEMNTQLSQYSTTAETTLKHYTKTQTDGLLNAKQDKLTAGDGITIDSSNVISSTDNKVENGAWVEVVPKYEEENTKLLYSKANRYTLPLDTVGSTLRFDMLSAPLAYSGDLGDNQEYRLVVYMRDIPFSDAVNQAWGGGYASAEKGISMIYPTGFHVFQAYASAIRHADTAAYADVVLRVDTQGLYHYRVTSPQSYSNISLNLHFLLIGGMQGNQINESAYK